MVSRVIGPCRAEVELGDLVVAGQPLAEGSRDPAPVIVEVAAELKRPPKSVVADLTDRLNTLITHGELIASVTGPLGLGRKSVVAPVSGQVIAVLEHAGALVIQPERVQQTLTARFPARVTAVRDGAIDLTLEGRVVSGVASTGSDVSGVLRLILNEADLAVALRATAEPAGTVLSRIFATRFHLDAAVAQAATAEYWRPDSIALIVPSLHYDTFRGIETSHPGISLFVAHGFGVLPFGSPDDDATWQMLTESEGSEVAVLAAREENPPFVVGPAVGFRDEKELAAVSVGDGVVLLDSLDLKHGTVVEVPEGSDMLPSGQIADVARVALDEGGVEVVTRRDLRVVRSGSTQA